MRYEVFYMCYGRRVHSSFHTELDDAIRAAVIQNEVLSDGDDGITYIHDTTENANVQIGNGAFRNYDAPWDSPDRQRPLEYIRANLHWTKI